MKIGDQQGSNFKSWKTIMKGSLAGFVKGPSKTHSPNRLTSKINKFKNRNRKDKFVALRAAA